MFGLFAVAIGVAIWKATLSNALNKTKMNISTYPQPRCTNTDSAGRPFDQNIIEAVWEMAAISKKFPPLRVDCFGALIFEHGYGVRDSKFGWEIDHCKPVAKGGGDELLNLQPLQWENNRTKADNWPAAQGG